MEEELKKQLQELKCYITNLEDENKKLKEDKEKLIIQLVDMEELKNENKRLRESLDKIKSIK